MTLIKFKHPAIELAELPFRIPPEGGHEYQSFNGQWYKSVTTFLGEAINSPGLDEWRANVGEEAANAATARGGRRGTAVHKLLEAHLLNETIDYRRVMPVHLDLFQQIKNLLDLHLTEVYMLETAIYSDKYELAGTPDLIGIWNGMLSIVDFKTANTEKRRKDVVKHFLQTAAYKILFGDTMNHDPKFNAIQLVVIVASQDSSKPQLFVEPATVHVQEFDKLWREKHPAGKNYIDWI